MTFFDTAEVYGPLQNEELAWQSESRSFESLDGPRDEVVNREIDEAYRVKYRGSPYLTPMIGERARAATGRIVPVS